MQPLTIEEIMSARICYWCDKRGVKPSAIIRKLDVSRSAVSKWLSGVACPSQRNLYALCEVLEIEMWEFWASSLAEIRRNPKKAQPGKSKNKTRGHRESRRPS